jgi:hypothetical protein
MLPVAHANDVRFAGAGKYHVFRQARREPTELTTDEEKPAATGFGLGGKQDGQRIRN